MATIDQLQIEISDNSEQVAPGLDTLSNSLNLLKNATKNLGLKALSNNITSLGNATKSLDSSATGRINGLVTVMAKLRALDGIKISSTLSTQLNSLGSATKSLSGSDFSTISKLVDAVRPLGELGKSQLTSFINQLNKLPEVAKNLATSDIDKFAKTLTKIATAMRPLATEMDKVARGFSAMPNKIQRLITQTDKLGTSNIKTSKTYGLLGTGISGAQAKFAIYIGVMRRAMSVLGVAVLESNDYVENLNLFTVAMGSYAEEALSYAKTVQQAMGIDMSDFMRNQGIIMQMATGFGVVEDMAYTMSKSLTQLGYDISSFYNIKIEEAMQKVQSGLAGELEPLRRLGYALDQATLKQIALDSGITQSLTTMTQAQKSLLRYSAMINQSSNVMGDMARTILTPANAMRILQQQTTQLVRALGNMFIPILIKIIPYVQSFVQVLTEAIQFVADLFGFKLPTIDYSSLEGVSSTTDGISDSMGEATKASKKLSLSLAGFDEIQNINNDKGDGESANVPSAGAGGDLGLDLKGLDYNFLGDLTEKLGSIKEAMRTILPFAVSIGAAFLTWKLTKGLAPVIKSISSFLTGSELGAGVLTQLGAGLSIVAGLFTFAYINSENFRDGLGAIVKAIGDVIGWITGGISSLVDLVDISGETMTTIVMVATTAIATLMLPIAPILAGIALVGAGVTLVIQGIGAVMKDEIKPVNLFAEGVSELSKLKMEPFINQLRELDDTLNNIALTDTIISDNLLVDLQTKTIAIREMILDELSADRNEALATLSPLKESMGDEAYARLLAQNSAYYDRLEIQVTEDEAAMNAIYAKAHSEKRSTTEAENIELAKISAKMSSTGLKQMSESEVEYNTIMNRMSDNRKRVSLEQASVIIKNSMATRDATISDAETQYSRIQLEAQRMLEVGAIDKATYDDMVTSAATTRDSTIASANTQYEGIHLAVTTKLGESAKYIDGVTGEIKSGWDVFCTGIGTWWDTTWLGITGGLAKSGKWISDTISGFCNGVSKVWTTVWAGIANFFIGIWNTIIDVCEKAINSIIDMLNGFSFKIPEGVPGLGGQTIGFSLTRISLARVEYLPIPEFASGGFPEPGQMFIANEAGTELVGKMGNRTTVANQQQIVDGISYGVSMANGEQNSLLREQNILLRTLIDKDSNLYIDGEKLNEHNNMIQFNNQQRNGSPTFAIVR